MFQFLEVSFFYFILILLFIGGYTVNEGFAVIHTQSNFSLEDSYQYENSQGDLVD
jgi:hypothetical protein